MTERRKELLWLAGLLVLLLLCYSKILFTDKVIRAPDITNEFYWGVVAQKAAGFIDIFDFNKIKADWNIYINSGVTSEGGTSPIHLLFWHKLILYLIPAPACVAWHIVLHLFFGATGIFMFCRTIGLGRPAAFLGGLIFALAPENASLINAGHVMKIATIVYAPWAFYFLERGFQSKRVIFFLATGFTLAFQFFNTHWQIAFYTCLSIGIYAVMRSIGILRSPEERKSFPLYRLFGMNLVVLFFFISTVSIALMPLANWSKDTNRGVQSGANQGKGGLDREEAMMWSLPPEEVGAFIIPGFFGLSRQEGGANPTNIPAYYWGRMVFTQTVSYMGLLPWLLLPLPLIFRRDKYMWLALAALVGGLLFSMGKYTPFYNFLFDHLPGIDRFRVPKMIMFIPVMGLGVLAARGLDILLDEKYRDTLAFRRYITGIFLMPLALVLLLAAELIGRDYWINRIIEMLAQPTRYEQGPQLIMQRWNNLVVETGIAAGLATLFAGVFWAFQRRLLTQVLLPVFLIILFLADVGRINNKFMFLVDEPHKAKGVKSAEAEYLAKESKQYRVIPMDGTDPMQYVANEIPVMFTSNAVQQRRWQEVLDAFSLVGPMPDMLNVKHVIMGKSQYEQEKAQLGPKFRPVYQSPDGEKVVLENRTVLPKAWLSPAAVPINDLQQTLAIMQDPQFDPRKVAIVETPPPIAMGDPNSGAFLPADSAAVTSYEGERMAVTARSPQNALLVLGEKYYRGWKATVDGKSTDIVPVNHILRGVYLPPGEHKVEFIFDPLPFKVGKWLTIASFGFFSLMLVREATSRRKRCQGGM